MKKIKSFLSLPDILKKKMNEKTDNGRDVIAITCWLIEVVNVVVEVEEEQVEVGVVVEVDWWTTIWSWVSVGGFDMGGGGGFSEGGAAFWTADPKSTTQSSHTTAFTPQQQHPTTTTTT